MARDPEGEDWVPLTKAELENPGDAVLQAGSRLLEERDAQLPPHWIGD